MMTGRNGGKGECDLHALSERRINKIKKERKKTTKNFHNLYKYCLQKLQLISSLQTRNYKVPRYDQE